MIRIIAVDSIGNNTTTIITKDASAPAATISVNPTSASINVAMTVNFTEPVVTSNLQLQLVTDRGLDRIGSSIGSWQNNNQTWVLNAYGLTLNYFGVASINIIGVTDLAGNALAMTRNLTTFLIDNIAPTFSAIQVNPSTANNGDPITISFGVAPGTLTPSVSLEEPFINGSNPATLASVTGNTYTYTYTIIATANEGFVTLTIQALDNLGNSGSTLNRTFYIDNVAPLIASLILNATGNSQVYADRALILVSMNVSGAVSLNISGDLTANGIVTPNLWMAYVPTIHVTLTAGDANKNLLFSFSDSVGNITTQSASIQLATSGVVAQITINAGAVYTNTRNISLAITDNATSAVSMNIFGNTNSTGWIPVSSSYALTLNGSEGVNTISVVLINQFQARSITISDTIILDMTAPTVSSVLYSPSSVTNNMRITFNFSESVVTGNVPTVSVVYFGRTDLIATGNWIDLQTWVVNNYTVSANYSDTITISLSGITDFAGNTMINPALFTVTVNSVPIVSTGSVVLAPTSNAVTSNPVNGGILGTTTVSVVVPTSSLIGNEQVTMNVYPTVNAASLLPTQAYQVLSQAGDLLVGFNLGITSRNSVTFNQAVTVTIYANFSSITTASVYIMYWDTLLGTWSRSGLSVQQILADRLIFTTTHFTSFGLFSDTIAPVISGLMINNQTVSSGNLLTGALTVNITVTDNTGVSGYKVMIYQSDNTLVWQGATVNVSGNGSYNIPISASLVNYTSYYITVRVMDAVGNTTTSATAPFQYSSAVSSLRLSNVVCAPNPYNPNNGVAHIGFVLNQSATVKLALYSISGESLWNTSGHFNVGYSDISWDGSSHFERFVANGVYLAYLVAEYDAGGKDTKLVKIGVLK
jgi:hypothetical protein